MKFFTNWIESLVVKAVAEQVAQHIDAADVLERVAEKVVGEKGIDLSRVAQEIDLSDLAQQFDTDDIAREIGKGYDIDEDKVAEKIADDISISDIASAVADNFDADSLDYSELARALLRQFAQAKAKS